MEYSKTMEAETMQKRSAGRRRGGTLTWSKRAFTKNEQNDQVLTKI